MKLHSSQSTLPCFDLSEAIHRIADPWRTLLTSFLFLIGLIIWENIFFYDSYFSVFKKITKQGYEIWPISYTINLIASNIFAFLITFAFIYISLRLPKIMQIVCFILFSTATLYQYGYFYALGRFASADDFIMLILYASDPILIRDSTLVYFNWNALIPITCYALLLWKGSSPKKVSATWLILLLSLTFLFYSMTYRVWYLTQYELPSTSFSGVLRSASFTPWKWMRMYGQEREAITYVSSQKPINNIIFIVDESIRSDHLSINGYERPTTPFLEDLGQDGLIYNWKEAVAATTTSLSTNNLLLTGIHNLPVDSDTLARQTTIFQYAKAMGYKTHYIDASNTTFWNGTPADLNYIDSWINAQRFESEHIYNNDIHMAEYVRDLISNSTGNFIWINKRGVHVLYNNTFPEDQAVWQPIMQNTAYTPEYTNQIINSYDNGILYNVDGFFRTLLKDQAVLNNTTILYTSDHGQTLAESGETWSHGKNTRNEARVPLFLISKTKYQFDLAYKAHHNNIFPTLLDLLGFPEEERRYTYDVSLFQARSSDSHVRHYFVGALDGSGAWELLPFDMVASK